MRDNLSQFVALVRKAGADPKDRALFKTVVDRALALGVATRLQFAGLCECAPSTVDRWCSGVAAPHHAIRALLYTWLIGKSLEQNQREANLRELLTEISRGEAKAQAQLIANAGNAQSAKLGDELFRVAVDRAITLGAVTEEEFVTECSAMRSTIYRWRSGQTMPGPGARAGIFRWLKGKVEAKLPK